MNTTNLEYINILGLFGRYNVEIPFDKQVNIFIGENGLGKTTILNCIYYILEKKFVKLAGINFSEIHVKFKNEANEYKITSFDIAKYNQRRRGHPMNYLDEEMMYIIDKLIDSSNFSSHEALENNDELELIIRNFAQKMEMPFALARRKVLNYFETKYISKIGDIKSGDKSKVDNLIKAIAKNINHRIIYLPTYRRIEDDLTTLNIRSEELNKSELLIRFGMSDVKISIERILEKIRSEAMKGFTEMTGVLLKQYADGQDIISISNDRLLYNIDVETVKIVLDRVGNEIEQTYKTKILDLIKRDEIYSYQYLYLLNLIGKLIANYDLQKRYDDRIKKFSDTCNKYLRNKHFNYNQSTLTLEIYLENDDGINEKTIELTQLSSGEKQIVSLFSKLYLESDDKSIVIIDEPELSLSLQWQQMLLPDIMRTENCELLLTVTHSPFIFENEFDYDAKEIRKYIKNTNMR